MNVTQNILEWFREPQLIRGLEEHRYAVQQLITNLNHSRNILQQWDVLEKHFKKWAQECAQKYQDIVDKNYWWKSIGERQQQKQAIHNDIRLMLGIVLKGIIEHGGEIRQGQPLHSDNRKIYSQALRFIQQKKVKLLPLSESEKLFFESKVEKSIEYFELSPCADYEGAPSND